MRWMGQTPSTSSCLKSDWHSPTWSAILHITMEPSWQWSPMKMSWLTPRTMGPCTPAQWPSIKMGPSCPHLHTYLCS